MALFGKTVYGKQKLSDVIDGYDATMMNVMHIGKALYQGYLPDNLLMQDGSSFSHLRGFHDYKIYTEKKDGTIKRRKTLRMPKIVTQYMNKLIYTENVRITAESEKDKTAGQNINDFIQEIIENENYFQKSSELSETMFNLGGKVERPRVEDNKIKIDYILGEYFHPTAANNKQVHSGVLWSKVKKNGFTYTKLIRIMKDKDGYEISKELYKSKDGTSLGNKVPYNSMYSDVEKYRLDGFKSVPFTYVKPNQTNDVVLNSPMGVPIWLPAIDTLEYIDLTFDQAHREMRYGGRTKVVPSYATRKHLLENGDKTKSWTSIFDPDDETVIKLNTDPDKDNHTKFEDVTSPIRDVSMINMINLGLDTLAFQTGFSVGTFRFDGKSMKTATEVLSEKEDTYKTIVAQEKNIADGHRNLFMSCIELANAMGLDSRVSIIPDDLEIITHFDDSIIVDDEKEAEKALTLSSRGDVPRWMGVMKSLGVSKEEAIELVKEARIEDEQSMFAGIGALEDGDQEAID